MEIECLFIAANIAARGILYWGWGGGLPGN